MAAIVLKPSDLPAGWTATPYKPDPQEAGHQAKLIQCAGGKNGAAGRIAQVHSPDFGLNGASVSSAASRFSSQEDVNADIALIHNPKISGCYEQLLRSQLVGALPSGGTVDAVSVKITPGSAGGPANVIGSGAGTVTVTVSGKQVSIYVAVAFITGPRTEAQVDIENPTRPVPAAFFANLVKTVAGRAASG